MLISNISETASFKAHLGCCMFLHSSFRAKHYFVIDTVTRTM